MKKGKTGNYICINVDGTEQSEKLIRKIDFNDTDEVVITFDEKLFRKRLLSKEHNLDLKKELPILYLKLSSDFLNRPFEGVSRQTKTLSKKVFISRIKKDLSLKKPAYEPLKQFIGEYEFAAFDEQIVIDTLFSLIERSINRKGKRVDAFKNLLIQLIVNPLTGDLRGKKPKPIDEAYFKGTYKRYYKEYGAIFRSKKGYCYHCGNHCSINDVLICKELMEHLSSEGYKDADVNFCLQYRSAATARDAKMRETFKISQTRLYALKNH
jgi:hypothetical protein